MRRTHIAQTTARRPLCTYGGLLCLQYANGTQFFSRKQPAWHVVMSYLQPDTHESLEGTSSTNICRDRNRQTQSHSPHPCDFNRTKRGTKDRELSPQHCVSIPLFLCVVVPLPLSLPPSLSSHSHSLSSARRRRVPDTSSTPPRPQRQQQRQRQGRGRRGGASPHCAVAAAGSGPSLRRRPHTGTSAQAPLTPGRRPSRDGFQSRAAAGGKVCLPVNGDRFPLAAHDCESL